MKVLHAYLAAVTLLGMAAAASTPPDPKPWDGVRYTLTLVASPIDVDVPTFLTGINDKGRLVGYALINPPTPETLLFTLDDRGYTTLCGLSGTVCSIAHGINQGGLPFGFCAANGQHDARATIWSCEHGPMAVGAPDLRMSTAWGYAERSSELVGEARLDPIGSRPVVWAPPPAAGESTLPLSPGSGTGSSWIMRELPSPGFLFGQARDADETGELIVGLVWNDSGETEGYVWARDAFWSIGTLQQGTFSALVAVNGIGAAVGRADKDGLTYAIRYDGRGLVPIKPLHGDFQAELTDINDQGIAVGQSGSDAGYRAVVAYGDELVDLNTRLVPSFHKRFVLEKATGINELGQIVGHGRMAQGQQVGFLLTPFD